MINEVRIVRSGENGWQEVTGSYFIVSGNQVQFGTSTDKKRVVVNGTGVFDTLVTNSNMTVSGGLTVSGALNVSGAVILNSSATFNNGFVAQGSNSARFSKGFHTNSLTITAPTNISVWGAEADSPISNIILYNLSPSGTLYWNFFNTGSTGVAIAIYENSGKTNLACNASTPTGEITTTVTLISRNASNISGQCDIYAVQNPLTGNSNFIRKVYPLVGTERKVIVNAASGSMFIELAGASNYGGSLGQEIAFKNISTTGSYITFVTNSLMLDTIEEASSYLVTGRMEHKEIMSDGVTSWYII